MTKPTVLTDRDQDLIAQAKELASVDPREFQPYTGQPDPILARAAALGRAQFLLAELAAVIERLDGAR